jgi:hypothetical protein
MLFVAWGTADEVIPPSTQDKYVNLLCTSGESLVYRSYPDRTMSASLPVTLRFQPTSKIGRRTGSSGHLLRTGARHNPSTYRR